MAEFDRVLIDPSPADLDGALGEAAAAANRGARARLLGWPPPGAAARDLLPAEREGWRQWHSAGVKGRPGRSCTAVALAWWTDFAGRRHCRVVGRRGEFGRAELNDLLKAGGRPLLRVVHPGSCFFRRVGGKGEWLTLCACGSLAPAEEVGWMGTCCGPCHDRREEGATPDTVLPPPEAWPRTVPMACCLAFAPEGNGLLSVPHGSGGALEVWDTRTGQRLVRLPVDESFCCMGACFHPDGAVLAVDYDGSVRRVGRDGTARRVELSEDDLGAEAFQSSWGMAVSPDGTLLARADHPGVPVWELATGHLVRRFGGETDLFSGLAFSPDGGLLAAGDWDGGVRVWHVPAGQEQARIGYGGGICPGLAFPPSGGLLAVSPSREVPAEAGVSPGPAPEVLLWDVARGKEALRLAGHRGGTSCLAWAPDGTVLVTGGGDDGTVKAWDASSGRELLTLEWHESGLLAVTVSPDGRLLATASTDGVVKLWPAEVLRPPGP
jgi:WD40 repeat protein